MPRRIILNSAAQSAASAAVNSASRLVPVAFPDIVAGNKIQYRIFLADGNGTYEPISGDVTNFTLKLALGVIETRTTLTSTTTFTGPAETIDGVATAGWQATLDCSVPAVMDALALIASKELVIELQVTETATGLITTYLQMSVQVRNRILA